MLSQMTEPTNRMTQRLKTAPSITPVTLTEAKDYLRIDHADEDALVTSLIKSATDRAEKLVNLKFITQTWLVSFDRWPEGRTLDLKIGRTISVTSIKYYNEDGTEATFDSANYSVNTTGHHGSIELKSGAVWPDAILRQKGAILVEVVVGFGAATTDVPEAVRIAILEVCAALYDDRGTQNMFAMPPAALSLLGPYRVAP